MAKTVLITGTSSGIGKETAIYFAEHGWQVVATMRNPDDRQTELHGRDDMVLMHLDVLDPESIKAAIDQTLEKYKKIDVLVNNAGYATQGPFEASTPEQIQKQFETNVFGLMAVTREILPVFRKKLNGTIINVASIGGRLAFPLYSIYNSTKWAVEGFSEGLYHELRPFNVRVKIIEPGLIATDFYGRSMDVMTKEGLTVYDAFVKRVKNNLAKYEENGSPPRVIAELIFKAANDKSWKVRYHGGKNAGTLLGLRKWFSDQMFIDFVHGLTK